MLIEDRQFLVWRAQNLSCAVARFPLPLHLHNVQGYRVRIGACHQLRDVFSTSVARNFTNSDILHRR